MANSIGHYEKIRALAVHARVLALAGERVGAKTEVTLFDHVSNKTLNTISFPTDILALSFKKEELIIAGSDGIVRIYDTKEKTETRQFQAHQGRCFALALSTDQESLATVGTDGYLKIWPLGKKAKPKEFFLSQQPLYTVAFDPSSEYVGAAGEDGIVRSIRRSDDEIREMPGHDGPVYALAFTPRDGRLVSGGDDGTLRIWYLEGEIESEIRGGDETGHTGSVFRVLFTPTPEATSRKKEPQDRMYSIGADGNLKAWRLEDRRKPKTISCGEKALYGMTFAPPLSSQTAKKSLGSIFLGGDERAIWQVTLDTAGAPQKGHPVRYSHGFDLLAQNLRGAKPGKKAALETLAPFEEPEALSLMLQALSQDRDYEIRALGASLLGKYKRREARPKLRERLQDDSQSVRMETLKALRSIDGSDSLFPLRAALSSRYPDLRKHALKELVPLREVSPLVPGLIAQFLTDKDAEVRLVALDQLSKLHSEAAALRIAYEKGPSDLKIEALVRAAFSGILSAPEVSPFVLRALDDKDADVRRIAFAVRVIERRPLLALLQEKDKDFSRTVKQVALRCARRRPFQDEKKGPNDKEIKSALQAIPGLGKDKDSLTENDIEVLLVAMACRTPDTALRGARGLAQAGDTRALGALLQLSRESSAALRKETALALQELEDPRAKKRLIWMLEDPDASVRSAALDAYTKLEKTSLSIAESSLRASHQDIRVRGLDRLVKIGPKGKQKEAVEELLENAIEDEAPKVRTEAFRTLWAWHKKDPQKALGRALKARFPDLRLIAVNELKRIKDSWAEESLKQTIHDRDAKVAKAAYDVVVKLKGKEDEEAYLLAFGSVHPEIRALGAKDAKRAPLEKVRDPLLLLATQDDDFIKVRIQALETLDKLLKKDPDPLYGALGANHIDYFGRLSEILSVRIRAAELLAERHDERLIEPMKTILADKDLKKHISEEDLNALRERAASSLATLGANKLVKYFATELLKDDAPGVREQASRGLATAAKKGDEGFLLDALGHKDVWVRSWAADGLARLGDERALPVLTGTLRHNHLPIRFASVISFAALGPEGYGGMLQGLEDPSKEVQEIIFSIILARDLRAFRKKSPPELLTSALSSQRPEVRFSAARALELRVDPEIYLEHVVEALTPPRPEKASAMKSWPDEEERARMLLGLAEALSSDLPEHRYAAASALRNIQKPREYFRAVKKVIQPRSIQSPWIPDTTPKKSEKSDTQHKKGWLRKLFSGGTSSKEGKTAKSAFDTVPDQEQMHLRRLAFGAYIGLLRQASSGSDEGHRVRRDSVDRIVVLGLSGGIGVQAAIPSILRALDDPHHLVRRAAFLGLKKLFPKNAEEPLSLALASVSADIARAALDEFADKGKSALPKIEEALSAPLAEVRRYAFELLEKLSPKGSLDPLLAALKSEYADLRLGVLEKLESSDDERVLEALTRAMESDHDDLRMRAAELLAARKDDRASGVLAAFLRADEENLQLRARRALVRLQSKAAIDVLAARLEESTSKNERIQLIQAIGHTRSSKGIKPLRAQLKDELPEVRMAAFEAALQLANRNIKREKDELEDAVEEERKHREILRRMSLAIKVFSAAVRSKDPQIRARAAKELEIGNHEKINDLLTYLFSDRDLTTRTNAVKSYAYRVAKKSAPTKPLEEILKAGTRELLLSAAEGLASKGSAIALRPLLLVTRAGEEGERERALLALGTLGDERALEEIEGIANGGTEEAPADQNMQIAAIEALGRLFSNLTDEEEKTRVRDTLETMMNNPPSYRYDFQQAAIKAIGFIGGERSRAKLEELLRNNPNLNWASKVQIIKELGKLRDPVAEQTLANELKNYQQQIRRTTRKALDKIFPDDRTRVEFLAVDSRYNDISKPAAAYLAYEGDPAQLLSRLTDIKNASLRRRLRYGLVKRDNLPVSSLSKLLAHQNPDMRQEAAWLIGTRSAGIHSAKSPFSSEEQKTLGKALIAAEKETASYWKQANTKEKTIEKEAWTRIVWALNRVQAKDYLSTACKILHQKEIPAPASVRREAARFIATLGGNKEVEILQKGLSDLSSQVRTAVAAALAKLAPKKAAKLALEITPFDPVAFQVTAHEHSPENALQNREGRTLLLPVLLAKNNIKEILAFLDSAKEKETKLDLIAALGRDGSKKAIETLEKIAFHNEKEEKNIRKAAYRALRRAQRKTARAKKYEAQA